jgi:hypothetical protein
VTLLFRQVHVQSLSRFIAVGQGTQMPFAGQNFSWGGHADSASGVVATDAAPETVSSASPLAMPLSESCSQSSELTHRPWQSTSPSGQVQMGMTGEANPESDSS